MKVFFRKFCSLNIIRLFIKALLALILIAEKIWSNLKYRALVKECSNSICHWSTEIKYGHNLKVGLNSRIGPKCTIGAKGNIIIGNNVVISKGVVIESAGLDTNTSLQLSKHIAREIRIEDNVWIGTNCIVLAGVNIGKNSIIGAGTVIVKDVPANSIVVSSPNRVFARE